MGKTATVPGTGRAEAQARCGNRAQENRPHSSEAITLFLTQVKLTKGLPFPLRVPNRESTIEDVRTRRGVETFDSVAAWAKRPDRCDAGRCGESRSGGGSEPN